MEALTRPPCVRWGLPMRLSVGPGNNGGLGRSKTLTWMPAAEGGHLVDKVPSISYAAYLPFGLGFRTLCKNLPADTPGAVNSSQTC